VILLWGNILIGYSATAAVSSEDSTVVELRLFSNDCPNEPSINRIVSIQKTGISYYLSRLKDSLQWKGYAEAGVIHLSDSLYNSITVEISCGRRWDKVLLRFDKQTFRIVNTSGKMSEGLSSFSLTDRTIPNIFLTIISHWENHGYPFAKVQLDDIQVASGSLLASVTVDKGPAVFFDTFAISGNAKISPLFVSALTRIKPGKPYDERLVRDIERMLRTLPYITVTAPPAMLFTSQKATPLLYINTRNNDVIDGIIGMAPVSQGLTPNDRFLITGDIKVMLSNFLGGGQLLDLNWRRFNSRSDELLMRLALPYVMKSPYGLDFQFNSVKFDTLFSTFTGRIGGTYHVSGAEEWKLFFQRNESVLITADTLRVKATKSLPQNQPMRYIGYGTAFKLNRLDYPFNPLKGFKVDVIGQYGTKQILKDNRINSIILQNEAGQPYRIYDSTVMKMRQYHVSGSAEMFFPFSKNVTLKSAVKSEGLYAPDIYFNELIRFGGVHSLRGFNEQSLFASFYSLINLELRYLTGQNSNLFVFFNAAYYEDRSTIREQPLTDTPFGFGMGAYLETGNGILTLIYALGSENNNPIRLEAGKIHIGFTALF